MNHPLTDKLCDQIVCSTPPLPRDQQNRVLSYDGRILDGIPSDGISQTWKLLTY